MATVQYTITNSADFINIDGVTGTSVAGVSYSLKKVNILKLTKKTAEDAMSIVMLDNTGFWFKYTEVIDPNTSLVFASLGMFETYLESASGTSSSTSTTTGITVDGYIGKSVAATGEDFSVTYASANTLTLGAYPTGITAFTATDIVAVKKFDSTGDVVTYTRDAYKMGIVGNVLTVGSGAVFANTDTFVVYTNVPRPLQYAHTTSVETLVNESAWPGLTATTADGGSSNVTIIDAENTFLLADVGSTAVGQNKGITGYKVWSIVDATYSFVTGWTSVTQISIAGGTIASFASDTYKMPVAKTYEISMDTFNFLSFHYRLTADLNTCYTMKLYGTLDSAAVITSTVGWADLSSAVLGATAGIIADGITAAGTVIAEDIIILDTPTPMLKYMLKIVAEGKSAAASGSSAKVFVKKSS